jgi:hypothetical protein
MKFANPFSSFIKSSHRDCISRKPTYDEMKQTHIRKD